MAKLGFLGLGIMGYPMARNLLRAGHEVALWSNTASKAKELAAAEKGKFCDTPKQVAEFAECMFLCVGDTAMSEKVILGADGKERSIYGHPVHRVDARGQRRHSDLYGGRRQVRAGQDPPLDGGDGKEDLLLR